MERQSGTDSRVPICQKQTNPNISNLPAKNNRTNQRISREVKNEKLI